jgi:hypothetical protein
MTDLLPPEKGRPGRRRTVTANAWIDRRGKRGPWQSHVYAGCGRVHVLSAGTPDRAKALEFNRCHLLQILHAKPATPSEEVQLHLLTPDL